MRNWSAGATVVAGVFWMAAALVCLPRGDGRHTRPPSVPSVVKSAAASQATEVPRLEECSPPAPGAIADETVVSQAPSADAPSFEAPSDATATLADAVAELSRTVGGPDFAPAAENLRRALAVQFEVSDRDLEAALSVVTDLHTDGEVRAVVLEALAAGRGAERASQLAPALLLDPSTAVRQATWVHLLGRGEVACTR